MGARPRILLALPDPAEAAQIADWLTMDGIEPVPLGSLAAAIDEVESRPFDALIADSQFVFEGQLHVVASTCNPRAAIVAVGGADAALLADRFGTYHLDRPVDRPLLLCIITMAILEGRPARRSQRKHTPRFDAVVDGARGFVIDVSNEGLRVEIPRRFAPAPQFGLRIPLVDIALTVRRVWVATPGVEHATSAWCGVELFEPHPRAEENWRAFVETVPST
jgi:hypothetical protein